MTGEGDQLPGFPPGEEVHAIERFSERHLAEMDDLLAERCPEGRLEIDAPEVRLICLIHGGRPFRAGLVESGRLTAVPLRDFAPRLRQLGGERARLIKTGSPLVMMMAAHFTQRPTLDSSAELVDPALVLSYLARERRNAAISFERDGKRTLLFLHDGRPARLYFGDPADDPGEGDLEERVLLWAFARESPATRVAVFTDLKLEDDPGAGRSFGGLLARAEPPPPMDVCVYLPDGRELRRRPFAPPEMIIGRDPTVDLYIDNLAVSRRHARLSWEAGEFTLEDLGSANGTSVNGDPIERATVGLDDELEIGKFKIAFEAYDQAPAVDETLYIPLRSVPPPAYLVGDDVRVSLERDRLIGSSPAADARAEGWRVRPVHARVAFRDGEFEIVCFGGARVRLAGKRVRRARLALGDEFQVGRSRFVLRRAPGG